MRGDAGKIDRVTTSLSVIWNCYEPRQSIK